MAVWTATAKVARRAGWRSDNASTVCWPTSCLVLQCSSFSDLFDYLRWYSIFHMLQLWIDCLIATKLGLSRLLIKHEDKQNVSWFKQAPIYLASGLTAEMISGVIWTPMDVAKSRLQRGRDGYTTARSLLADVWQREGYLGLFRVSCYKPVDA